MTSSKTSGSDRLDRCNLRLVAGETSGTGMLWRPGWIVTCAHVVEAKGQEVTLYDGTSADPLAHGKVKKRGNPKGPDDLALVELTEPLLGRLPLSRFGIWERDQRFSVSGFPEGLRGQVSGRIQGQSSLPGWFVVDADSRRKIRPGFSGAALWSPEQEAVVGIVTHHEQDGLAHVIPKAILDDFLRNSEAYTASSFVEVDGTITNLSANRWVRVLDAKMGHHLGNGFRLNRRQVLTSRRFVEQVESLAVGDYPHFQPRPAQHLEEYEGSRITILETAPFEIPSFSLPKAPASLGGLALKIVGYRFNAESVADRVGFLGQLAVGEDGFWRVEGNTADLEEDASLIGSAVFLAEPSTDSPPSAWLWVLAGVLDLQEGDGRTEWVIGAIESAMPWVRVETEKKPNESEASRHLQQVRRVLTRSDMSRRAILDQDGDERWALAHHDATALASCLCLETEPDELTYRLFNAYCDLVDMGEGQSAEEIFEVLMHALPSSLRERWPVNLPEPLATETRLGLSGRILVDFVLAASEGGKSEFFVKPPRGTDFPLPTHQLPESVGELGYDLHARDVAREVASEAATRVAMSANAQHLSDLVGFWASRRSRPGGSRWIDPAELDELKAEDTPLLQAINQYLAEGTRAGRRFYFLAGDGDEALIRGLKRIVPELKLVTLESEALGGLDFGRLRRSLKDLFNRRHRLKDSKS